MRLLVLSDLHLEFGASLTVPPEVQYDVVVLAGDINSPGARAVHWAARESSFGGRPVVYVPGNHEFYGREMRSELEAMRKAAQGTSVHVLSRDAVVIDGVRFLGATLWTDFALPVANEDEPVDFHEEIDIARALAAANKYVNDFRNIEVATSMRRQYRERQKTRLLCAEDTLAMHWVDRDWLRRELDAGHDGATVVVTHHAPHRKSVAKRYRSDWVTPAFVSDLPDSFFVGRAMWVSGRQRAIGGPVLWVHGHTHSPFDYTVGSCRVISNPRGYRMRDSSWENLHFNPGLVVEVPAPTGSAFGAAHVGGRSPAGDGCVLFLDIDGVMHGVDANDDEQMVRRPLLEQWLRKRPSVDVVISSSWRNSHTLSQLREFFSPDLQERIIDVTDVYWRRIYEQTGEVPLTSTHERDREVVRWLEVHRASGRRWAALDDRRGNFAPGRINVVVCLSPDGLTERELDALDKILGFTDGG